MFYRWLSRFVVITALVLVVSLASRLSGVAIAAPAQATMTVEVDDNYFKPKALTVPAGTTVVWKSEGQHEHTVTADKGTFASEELHLDSTFTQTFNTPGTFAYFCKYHGAAGGVGMSGTIIVTAARAGGPVTTLPNTGANGLSTTVIVGLSLLLGALGLTLHKRSSGTIAPC